MDDVTVIDDTTQPSTGDNAVGIFLQIQKTKTDQQSKNKIMTARQEEAKQLIMNHLKQTNQTFIGVGNSSYLVIKKKNSKPSLSSELLSVIFKAFMTKQGQNCSTDDANEFTKFVDSQIVRLMTVSDDLVFSKSRPIASFF